MLLTIYYIIYSKFKQLPLFDADPDRIGLLGKPPAVYPLQEPVVVLASYIPHAQM
jgi:hypothetical protein